MFVVINIVCIYYQKKILGKRKSFLIWQCYTKKGNIKVSKNTKQKKKRKETDQGEDYATRFPLVYRANLYCYNSILHFTVKHNLKH